MATNKVTISFKDYFQEEYEFLNQQHNRSLFICELIREYMNGGNINSVKCSTMKPKFVEEKVEEEVPLTSKNNENEEIKEKKKKKIGGIVR